MQSVSSRIWTRVAVSISFDDNHYTTGTSFLEIYIDHFENPCVSVSLWSLWVPGLLSDKVKFNEY